jgi:hypothetical protein
VLADVAAEMQDACDSPIRFSFDQAKLGLDIIVPEFRVAPRLQHFSPMQSRQHAKWRGDAAKTIRAIWERRREEHPTLWSFARWQQEKLDNTDPRDLSSTDFAERMRMKRDAKARKEEGAEAAEEEGR